MQFKITGVKSEEQGKLEGCLRIVDDLEAVSFFKREIVRCSSFIVVQGHKEGNTT